MGIDLLGKGQSLSCSADDWRDLTGLATQFGWTPRGTLAPRYFECEETADWNGGYASNDGQIIDEVDANNMRIALKALRHDMLKEDDLLPSERKTSIDLTFVDNVIALLRNGAVTIL